MTLAAAPSGTAGPLGLLIVLLLGVAVVLLVRNMNGRLRRLPPSFDDPKKPADPTNPPANDSPNPPVDPTSP
ncbi:MAG: hypothetical protein QOE84_3410 [Actinomycetota bacterium]|nr:hypothetical protein [Actinomycetota bacterium]